MGIALFGWPSWLGSLQNFAASWFRAITTGRCASAPAPGLAAATRRDVRPVTVPRHCHEHARRPLRVLRVVEGSQTSCAAGRMVISGRMADVCAELDRLAALEAQAS